MDFSFKVVWLLLVAAMTVHGAPMSKSDADDYVKKFGHKDIKSFQQWAGLTATGILDGPTKKLMSTPRCGIADTPGSLTAAKGERAGNGAVSKWPIKDLVYNVSVYSAKMTPANVDTEIARAWSLWQAASQLKFTKWTSGATNINISFVAGDHGDGSPFDGPSGVLAHAYYPSDGRAHFDEAETWTMLTSEGINFFQVCLHEFGHVLGLSHIKKWGNIMQPYYKYDANAGLGPDDITAIQRLYGLPAIG